MITPSLPNASAALDRIVAAVAAEVSAGVTVKRIGGAFDATEIRRHVTVAPAVLVACLGLSEYSRRSMHGWAAKADFAAYILTRDTPAETRDRSALTLAAETLQQVVRANWGDPTSFGLPDAQGTEASNLYSGDIDSIAVALWAVTWRQNLYLSMP